jgi:hypothetical protein
MYSLRIQVAAVSRYIGTDIVKKTHQQDKTSVKYDECHTSTRATLSFAPLWFVASFNFVC